VLARQNDGVDIVKISSSRYQLMIDDADDWKAKLFKPSLLILYIYLLQGWSHISSDNASEQEGTHKRRLI